MDSYLRKLIEGEITYIPCNSIFMSLIDDIRTNYIKNPTEESLLNGISILNVYITNNYKNLQADLRLLQAIVISKSKIIC